MPRSKDHGNGRLDEAMATMLQTQAAMVAQFAQFEKEMAQLRREGDEVKRTSDERFARIEAILLEHNRILSRLADTVGEKIGFKTTPSPQKADK